MPLLIVASVHLFVRLALKIVLSQHRMRGRLFLQALFLNVAVVAQPDRKDMTAGVCIWYPDEEKMNFLVAPAQFENNKLRMNRRVLAVCATA